jgi:hypothetical protein
MRRFPGSSFPFAGARVQGQETTPDVTPDDSCCQIEFPLYNRALLPAYAESHGRQPVDECKKRVPSALRPKAFRRRAEALAKEGMLRRVTPKHG